MGHNSLCKNVTAFIILGIGLISVFLSFIFLTNEKKQYLNKSRSIPYKLWQTYQTHDLGRECIESRETWSTMNTSLPMAFMDDGEIHSFIQNNFEPSVYDIFKSYPKGVMRADFWRYAILLVHGGIYADIDTVSLRPIRKWLPFSSTHDDSNDVEVSRHWFGNQAEAAEAMKRVSWDSCSILIAAENKTHFCQWVRSRPSSLFHVNCSTLDSSFLHGCDCICFESNADNS